MEKTVIIDGKPVRMKASALIPRLYRFRFGRDLMSDMAKLKRAYETAQNLPDDAPDDEREAAQLTALDLTIFENLAWLMIRHAGEDIPDSPDEWLASIEGVFSFYDIMPVVMEMWAANQQTTSTPKKN